MGEEEEEDEEEEEEEDEDEEEDKSGAEYEDDDPEEHTDQQILTLQELVIDLESTPKREQIHVALEAAIAEENSHGGYASKTWAATLAVLQNQPVADDLRDLLPESLRVEGGWNAETDCPEVTTRCLLPGDATDGTWSGRHIRTHTCFQLVDLQS